MDFEINYGQLYREKMPVYLSNPNMKIPKQFLNPVYPARNLDGIWLAFIRLSTQRQIGMESGPIPYFDILKYCEIKKFDEETEFIYLNCLERMDAVYLKIIKEKSNKESNGKGSNTSGKGPSGTFK